MKSLLTLIILASPFGWLCDQIDPPELRVSYVVDGDTLTLTNGVQVRMAGYNTAELGEKDYYRHGMKLAQLVIGREVRVVDVGDGAHGRRAMVVYTPSGCVNAKMRKWLKGRKFRDYNKYDSLSRGVVQKRELLKCGVKIK